MKMAIIAAAVLLAAEVPPLRSTVTATVRTEPSSRNSKGRKIRVAIEMMANTQSSVR